MWRVRELRLARSDAAAPTAVVKVPQGKGPAFLYGYSTGSLQGVGFMQGLESEKATTRGTINGPYWGGLG